MRGHILDQLLARHHCMIREILFEVSRYLGLARPSLILGSDLIHEVDIRKLAVSSGRFLHIILRLPIFRVFRDLLLILLLYLHGSDSSQVLVGWRHENLVFLDNGGPPLHHGLSWVVETGCVQSHEDGLPALSIFGALILL